LGASGNFVKQAIRNFALAAGVLCAGFASGETVRNHFDTDSPMRPPGFFDAFVLGAPGPAKWLVLTDSNPPSAPNRLAQVETKRPADSIAAVVRRNYVFQDGTVTTYLKKGGGRGGMILRMAGEKDFLVLLVDPSGDAVLTSYRGGRATELGRGRAKLENEWAKFGVVASGPSLTVTFDDQKLFDAKDPAPATGKAGLATAGPGETSFDEFVLEFTPKP